MDNLLKNNKKLMSEYNYEKNKEFDLDTLTLGSDRKIWWICDKGHAWDATIGSRNRQDVGCPICANIRVLEGYNDLLSQKPEIAKEWNYKKNDIKPNNVFYSSSKKVWWICKYGHEWEATISNRTKENGTNCPYCTNQKILKGYNDLATKNPNLVKEWNYKRNTLLPTEVGSNSKKVVWWKCKNNHEWEQAIIVRNQGIGCPYCSGKRLNKGVNDLLSKYPRIAKEWDYEKNKEKPNEVFSSSSKLCWWICPKGHSYQQTINNRVSNHGCPICSKEKVTSFQEKIVFFYIKKYFKDTMQNYRFKELGKREIDIFIPSLNVGIEYDGGYYHNNLENDIEKDKICKKLGIKLYRIRDAKCDKLNSTSICYYRKDKSNNDLEIIIKSILEDLKIKQPIINIDSDLEDIYKEIDYTTKEKSLLSLNPNLAKEWDYKKNGNLKPDNISLSSSKKVWWICSKGHEFQATVNHRSKGQNCPYCSGNKILKGFNDIKTTNPELLNKWDFSKNKILPEEISYGSGIPVWWICPEGHSYKRIIKAELNGSKCPICNPLTKTEEAKIKEKLKKVKDEWDLNKNSKKLEDSLEKITAKSWWICPRNHSYQMSIYDRYKGFGCPYCSGHKVLIGFNDLQTTNPEILKDWDYKKNKDISPTSISNGSNNKVWWKCNKCGHEWQAFIYTRAKGSGCPICNSNSIKVNQYTKEGKFIKQFNSCSDAGKSIGISGSGISYACKNKSLTNNFQWRFDENNTNDIESYSNSNQCIKKVKQYSLDYKYIKTFDSLIEATKETGAKKISEVCKGKRKSSGGYIWEYVEEEK